MGILTPVGGYVGSTPEFFGARPGVYRLDEQYELVKRLAWPIAVGTSTSGGYYCGTIEYATDNSRWHLILAPKALGESPTILQQKTSNTSIGGDNWDGYSNTYVHMNSATYPAAFYCAGLNIDGFSDWYLPSRSESEIVFTVVGGLVPWQTGGAEEFTEGTVIINGSSFGPFSAYWTSTAGGHMRPLQYYVSGYPYTDQFFVRAIRRIPFTP